MLGIMSRGYICPIIPIRLPGPAIIDQRELRPVIRGSAQEVLAAPSITSAQEQAPSIVGAKEDPTPPSPGAPSVTGGEELVPIIRRAEED